MTPLQAIRIGTRESALALYQARAVAAAMEEKGAHTRLVEISSDGDVDLHTPLYEMGIQGIFTKSLDIALLDKRIDIAVHSAKDIPTKLAKGLRLCAVLKRGSPLDCLVLPSSKTSIDFNQPKRIATSSLRRKSQWLARYPKDVLESFRGNIQTRLKKLDQSEWDGAIFAHAAIERLEITSHAFVTLDWMLPAPAQGAIAVVCRDDDAEMNEATAAIHDVETGLCVEEERDFLAALHGGCAVPIAAYATIERSEMRFRGSIFSYEGDRKCEVDLKFPVSQAGEAGKRAASEILRTGGEPILRTFRPA